MSTTRTLALVAAAFFLLAPVAHAEQEDLFRPLFSSIMVGASLPANEDFEGGSECIFVWGFMENPYFGWQMELGGVAVSDDNDNGGTFYDIAASIKLALPIAFIEPYLLGGAGVGYEGPHWGFPLYAAVGIDFNFGKVLVGAEARQVWLEVDGRDYDALLVMSKFGFRF